MDLLSAITAAVRDQSLVDPESWTVRRVVDTATDVTVVFLGPENGTAAAVARVARTPAGAESAWRNAERLAEVRADPRLGVLFTVLPAPLAAGEVEGLVFTVEDAVAGRPGIEWIPSSERLETVQRSAIDLLANLHGRTSAPAARLDVTMIESLVDRPLEAILQGLSGLPHDTARTGAVDRLASELHASLDGATASLGWTHGDFWLGNILTSRDGERITGLVDWDAATPNGLYGIDMFTLALTTEACAQYVDFGRVVRAWLAAAPASLGLRRLVSAARREGFHALDDTSLVLLSWIAHVSTKLDKCPEYRRRAKWVHNNVDIVLDAFRAT